MTTYAFALLVFLSSTLTTPQQPKGKGIESLAWLQGCWELTSPQRTVEEQWMVPRGSNMLGMSRTIRGGALAEYELMLIRQQGDRFAYEAHPSGQPSAVFMSKEIKDAAIVFENPEHDFPQTIGYQKTDANTLVAWVEGTEKGQRRRIEFPYRRAACPAQ